MHALIPPGLLQRFPFRRVRGADSQRVPLMQLPRWRLAHVRLSGPAVDVIADADFGYRD